jgi:hypothetical protein
MLNNKKGSLWIVVLVFLILFLVGFTLFRFVLSNDIINSKIDDVNFLQGFILAENDAQFILKQLADSSFLYSYEGVVNNGINGKSDVFLYTSFENTFNSKIKEEFSNYEFEEDYLNQVKNKILSGDYVLSFEDNNMKIILSDLSFSNSTKNIEGLYIFDIEYEREIYPDFDFIDEVYSECESDDLSELRGCYNEKMEGYDAYSFGDGLGNRRVELYSKKKYLIGSDFRKIVLHIDY